MEQTRDGIWDMLVVWYKGKTSYQVCGMVCVDGMVRENTVPGICYGTFAVWYHVTVSWVYYMAKFTWWYGMFQYIRPVRVEYVVRISSVTTLYIYRPLESARKYKACGQTYRQTDRQTDIQICNYQNRDSVLQIKNRCPVLNLFYGTVLGRASARVLFDPSL